MRKLLWVVLAAVAFAQAPGGPVSDALALAHRGEYAPAIKQLEAAARAGDGEARLELGRLLLATGKKKEAADEFVAMVEDFNTRKPADSESLTWAGAAGAYTGSAQQAIRILEMAEKADPSNVRALVESGRLFAQKYQTGDAERELKAALKLDRRNTDAWLALAQVAFAAFRFDDTKRFVQRLLELDASRYEGRLLLARVYLQEDETHTRARAEIDLALTENPRDPEALSLLAAQQYLTANTTGFEEAAARALAVNPACAPAFEETARILARARRRREAEPLFRRALAVDADHVPSLRGLGKLMLDIGRETAGRELLERASKLDAFLVPVVNLLKTLDVMDDEMVWAGRGDLLFRYHPWRDAALQTRLPAFAESCMKTLGAAPGFSGGPMPVPTWELIEVFPEHKWFSARLVGVNWNGPVGACEGNIVVLDPPNALGGDAGCRQVMQHELAHSFHIVATDGQLPNWFTEGFATYEEAAGRAYLWDRALARAHRLGALHAFDTLNQGFLSPRDPGDWLLSYVQAELAIERIVERCGPLAPVRMLQAYSRGLKTPEVIHQTLGLEPAKLAADLEEHWKTEAAASLAWPTYYPNDLMVLQKKYKSTGAPSDGAELARALLQGGLAPACRKVLETALGQDANCAPALAVAGDLAFRTKDCDKAAELLSRALKLAPSDYGTQALAARVEARLGHHDAALKLARAAIAVLPRGPSPYETLAEIARAKKDAALLKESLEAWSRVSDASVAPRVERARIALDEKSPKEALAMLEAAAEIDPVDAELNQALAQTYEALGRPGDARHAWRDSLAARWLGGIDGTPPATTVTRVAAEARDGDSPRAQGAADVLGLLDEPESLRELGQLAKQAAGHVALRAAIGLGRRGQDSAMSGLLRGLECIDCAGEAARALSALTGRPEERSTSVWRNWWEAHRSGSAPEWLEESLGGAGYPLGGTRDRPRQAVLVVALEDRRWYIRLGALAELKRLTGKAFGTGAFGPEGDREAALGRARVEAVERWKLWLRES
ncbi:MAG: tetratricopeptide repeat protein [Candidatus Wallbacteria bacterium]|nr:tetratricopeptide repeat protein [Candidatus Wallbacteria bacterium]